MKIEYQIDSLVFESCEIHHATQLCFFEFHLESYLKIDRTPKMNMKLEYRVDSGEKMNLVTHSHTATHCNTLQHTATHCNTRQLNLVTHLHTATHCNTLQHTATHCNTRQLNLVTHSHTATHCNTRQLNLVTHSTRYSYF